jgi:hypothetical protein
MSDSDQDDEFEAYLKRRMPIDKGLNPIEPLEPPPELDRIVIGKARKAIQGAAPIHLYRAPKWALPVGLAATILLSFAILLDLGVRAKRNDASLQAARTQTSGITTPQSQVPGAEPRAPSTPAAASASSAPAVASDAEAEELSSDRARTRLARAEKAAKRARPEQDMAVRALEEAVVVGQRKSSEYAPGAPAPIAAPSGGLPPTAARAPIVTAPMDAMQSISPPDFAAVPAPPAPNSVATPSASADKPEAANAAVSAAATSVAAPAPSESTSANEGTLDPASWLTRIEKLRSSGHTAEAEREMKRFRATYPDYSPPKGHHPEGP